MAEATCAGCGCACDDIELTAAGRPVCTVVAIAATPDEALAGLEEEAGRLRAELRVEVATSG